MHVLFAHRYGQPTHVIARKVIPRGLAKEPQIELFPPRFRVYRLAEDSSATPTEANAEIYVESSEAELVMCLLSRLASTSKPGPPQEYRIWKIQQTDPIDGDEFPKTKLIELGGTLVEAENKTLSDASIDSDYSFVVEFKRNGVWLMDSPSTKAPTASDFLSIAHQPPPLFGNGDFFKTRGPLPQPPSTIKPAGLTTSALSTIRKKPAQTPGTMGLGNM